MAIFKELASVTLKDHKVALNYFGEYHGKCVCDSHFSLLSRYYSEYTKSAEFKEPRHTSKGLIEILRYGVLQSNKFIAMNNQKMKKGTKTHPLLHVKFFEYVRDEFPRVEKQINTKNFTSFYHFTLAKSTRFPRILAKVHQSDTHVHEYEAKVITVKMKTERTFKKGWEGSQKAEFSVQSLNRKENFVKNCFEAPKKKKVSRKQKKSAYQTSENSEPCVSIVPVPATEFEEDVFILRGVEESEASQLSRYYTDLIQQHNHRQEQGQERKGITPCNQ